eukprot:SAG31_NODE_253_length_19063_cov_31.913362_10_plen_1357_part_00
MWSRKTKKSPARNSMPRVTTTESPPASINEKQQESLLESSRFLRMPEGQHTAQFYATADCSGDPLNLMQLQLGRRYYSELPSTGITLRTVRTHESRFVLSGPPGTQPVDVNIAVLCSSSPDSGTNEQDLVAPVIDDEPTDIELELAAHKAAKDSALAELQDAKEELGKLVADCAEKVASVESRGASTLKEKSETIEKIWAEKLEIAQSESQRQLQESLHVTETLWKRKLAEVEARAAEQLQAQHEEIERTSMRLAQAEQEAQASKHNIDRTCEQRVKAADANAAQQTRTLQAEHTNSSSALTLGLSRRQDADKQVLEGTTTSSPLLMEPAVQKSKKLTKHCLRTVKPISFAQNVHFEIWAQRYENDRLRQQIRKQEIEMERIRRLERENRESSGQVAVWQDSLSPASKCGIEGLQDELLQAQQQCKKLQGENLLLSAMVNKTEALALPEGLLASNNKVAAHNTTTDIVPEVVDKETDLIAQLNEQIIKLELEVMTERRNTAAVDAEADDRVKALECELSQLKQLAADHSCASEAANAQLRSLQIHHKHLLSEIRAEKERSDQLEAELNVASQLIEHMRTESNQVQLEHIKELEHATKTTTAALSKLANDQNQVQEQFRAISKAFFWLSMELEHEASDVDDSGVIVSLHPTLDWRPGWEKLQKLVLDQKAALEMARSRIRTQQDQIHHAVSVEKELRDGNEQLEVSMQTVRHAHAILECESVVQQIEILAAASVREHELQHEVYAQKSHIEGLQANINQQSKQLILTCSTLQSNEDRWSETETNLTAQIERLQKEVFDLHKMKANDKAKVEQKLQLAMMLQSLTQSQGERVAELEVEQRKLSTTNATLAAAQDAARFELADAMIDVSKLQHELAVAQETITEVTDSKAQLMALKAKIPAMIESGVKKGIEASEKDMAATVANHKHIVVSEQDLRLEAENEAAKLRLERDEAHESYLSTKASLEASERMFQEAIAAERTAHEEAQNRVRETRNDEWVSVQADRAQHIKTAETESRLRISAEDQVAKLESELGGLRSDYDLLVGELRACQDQLTTTSLGRSMSLEEKEGDHSPSHAKMSPAAKRASKMQLLKSGDETAQVTATVLGTQADPVLAELVEAHAEKIPAETKALLAACKERIATLASANAELERNGTIALATAKAEADSRIRLAMEREQELLRQLETAEEREVLLEKSLQVIELECSETIEAQRLQQQQAVANLVHRVQELRVQEKEALAKCQLEQAEADRSLREATQIASELANLTSSVSDCASPSTHATGLLENSTPTKQQHSQPEIDRDCSPCSKTANALSALMLDENQSQCSATISGSDPSGGLDLRMLTVLTAELQQALCEASLLRH